MLNRPKKIEELLKAIEPKLPLSTSSLGSYPTKGGDNGDDCLWVGLLASTGKLSALIGLGNCQAQADEPRCGMFYRSPARRETDNKGYEHFFSRDMALGVLLAFVRDPAYFYDHACRWLAYIDGNRPCKVRKPKWLGGGCLIRSEIYRYSPDDDRSLITPTMWALMGRVWANNGWSKNAQMKAFEGADGDVSIIEADQSPLGYQLHLKAVQAYLKFRLNQSREYAQRVSDICFERQPDNLFYEYLAKGNSEALKDKFIEKFPNPETFVSSDHWLWESTDQDSGKACGWDWVFLGRALVFL